MTIQPCSDSSDSGLKTTFLGEMPQPEDSTQMQTVGMNPETRMKGQAWQPGHRRVNKPNCWMDRFIIRIKKAVTQVETGRSLEKDILYITILYIV